MSRRAEYLRRKMRHPDRERSRSKRARAVRPRTINVQRLSVRELEAGRARYPETGYWRPSTRADCCDVPRPCPYVSCKWHLFVDVSERTGAIKLNFPDLEPGQMPPHASCALDVADRCGVSLDRVAVLLNLSREGARLLLEGALAKLSDHSLAAELASVREPASKQTEKQEVARIIPQNIPHPGLAKCGLRRAA